MTVLETPFVFLDTQVFVESRFVFGAGSLQRVSDLASAGRIELVMPDTTRREIEKKIREHAAEVAGTVAKLRTSAPALVIPDFDEAAATARLVDAFASYLKLTQATLIPFSGGVATAVLDTYFASRPPFGKGDKKHQFLDALAVEALGQWATDEEARIYVVSRDPDLEAATTGSDGLLYLKHLPDLFALIQVVDERAQALVMQAEGKIISDIANRFDGCGFIIIDEDGDVENIEVVDVALEDVVVQDIQDDVIRFVGKARVTFRADVSYWRSDNATWDSEDKVLIYRDKAEHRVEDEAEFDFLGSVVATGSDLSAIKDVFVELDMAETFIVDPYAVYYEDM